MEMEYPSKNKISQYVICTNIKNTPNRSHLLFVGEQKKFRSNYEQGFFLFFICVVVTQFQKEKYPGFIIWEKSLFFIFAVT